MKTRSDSPTRLAYQAQKAAREQVVEALTQKLQLPLDEIGTVPSLEEIHEQISKSVDETHRDVKFTNVDHLRNLEKLDGQLSDTIGLLQNRVRQLSEQERADHERAEKMRIANEERLRLLEEQRREQELPLQAERTVPKTTVVDPEQQRREQELREQQERVKQEQMRKEAAERQRQLEEQHREQELPLQAERTVPKTTVVDPEQQRREQELREQQERVKQEQIRKQAAERQRQREELELARLEQQRVEQLKREKLAKGGTSSSTGEFDPLSRETQEKLAEEARTRVSGKKGTVDTEETEEQLQRAFQASHESLETLKLTCAPKVQAKIDDMLAQIDKLYDAGHSCKELTAAMNDTLTLLKSNKDPEDLDAYRAVANKIQGHASLGWKILGILMMAVGAAVAAFGLATGLTGVDLGLTSAGGASLFAAGSLTFYKGTQGGLSKAMSHVAFAVEAYDEELDTVPNVVK